MSKQIQLIIKRAFDIVSSVAVLVFTLPFMIILAYFVKQSSVGPVFFIQERVGLDEKNFRMIKFRTMSGQPVRGATRWTKSEEARITPVGAIMRDYGLDELPQIFNIIKGDMSIIGPRPPLPQQVNTFSPFLKKMFEMRPGVLSLAAIEGRRSLPMEKRYMLHVRYVELWSLKLDLKILWQSLFVVLGRISATEEEVE